MIISFEWLFAIVLGSMSFGLGMGGIIVMAFNWQCLKRKKYESEDVK